MPYRCLIIDDEALARELLETYLAELDDFEWVASCEDALAARQVLQQEKIDLLFLDIEMPVLKGTAFMRGLNDPPKVIFTTAYRDYAIEGFDLNAVDYLLKPIEFDRFFAAIQKFSAIVQPNTHQSGPAFIYVQRNKKYIKLPLADIRYIESLKDYILIHLEQEQLKLKYSISAFQEKLDQRFLRVHRSFLVNTDKVTAFTKQDVEIGKKEIPIGDFYKATVLQKLHK